MTLDRAAIESAIEELRLLFGGRIQRVDLVDELEIVLELRYPGRSVRILACARSGSGRIHVVSTRPPRVIDGGDLQRILRKRLEGRTLVSIALEEAVIAIDAGETVLRLRLDGAKSVKGVKGVTGVLSFGAPSGVEPPPLPEPEALPERFPISESIAARFAARTEGEAAESIRTELLGAIAREQRKLDRLRANLDRDRERLEALVTCRHEGELLKTVLGQVGRGQSEVEVTDWETGAKKTLVLDPALSPAKNLERFFHRAKKAERGLPIVRARGAKVEAELDRLERSRSLVAAADLEELVAVREQSRRKSGADDEALIGGTAPPKSKAKRKPIDQWARRFSAADGTEIRVGKGAKENDRLTFSASRGDDIWLHASGTSGAHVLLRVEKGASPSPEALLDAATLAGHYSGARANSKVEVIYTEARHVKKMKGAPPGQVSVARAKTMLLTLDPARIDRLFGRHP